MVSARMLCGIVAGPLFVGVWLALGAARRGYDPCRHPVSSLAIGPGGWVQTANFVVAGILIVILALEFAAVPASAMPSRRVPLLVAASGLGLVGAGLFTSDPVFGFPEGLPFHAAQFSIHGHLHDASSLLFFLCLPAAALCSGIAWRTAPDRTWSVYSIASGVVSLLLFLLTSVAFRRAPALAGVAGLLQRAAITVAMAWLAALAIRHLRPGQAEG